MEKDTLTLQTVKTGIDTFLAKVKPDELSSEDYGRELKYRQKKVTVSKRELAILRWKLEHIPYVSMANGALISTSGLSLLAGGMALGTMPATPLGIGATLTMLGTCVSVAGILKVISDHTEKQERKLKGKMALKEALLQRQLEDLEVANELYDRSTYLDDMKALSEAIANTLDNGEAGVAVHEIKTGLRSHKKKPKRRAG